MAYLGGDESEMYKEEIEAQLATTLAHLKAVLGEDDGQRPHPSQLMYCKYCNDRTSKDKRCQNPDCPRYKARQHVKELEGEG